VHAVYDASLVPERWPAVVSLIAETLRVPRTRLFTLAHSSAQGRFTFTHRNSLEALGLADSVTAFTIPDFGRTFKPAASAGTDHRWGNYAFVVGGAVKGGDFYGTLPAQALNGPDDLGNAGRWFPTTSVKQYGATLARWFGIAEGDLPYVFPNLGTFGSTTMGFIA
jgi:uncharacterized protein (DUF1501 family)